MKHNPVSAGGETLQSLFASFGGGAPDESMHLITQRQKQLGEVAAILSGNSGDERSLHLPSTINGLVEICDCSSRRGNPTRGDLNKTATDA
jgi:hypothetical protein